MTQVNKKHYTYFFQTFLVAMILFFSRSALIFREILIASKYGATQASDQFYLILSFVIFFSNFVGISILSVYASKIVSQDQNFKQQEYKGFFFIFGGVLFLLNFLAIILYFYWNDELHSSTFLQTLLMSASLPFSVSSYYNQALLNARGSFKKYVSIQLISPLVFLILLGIVPSEFKESLSLYYLISIFTEFIYSEKMEGRGFLGVNFSLAEATNFFSKNIEKGFIITLVSALISNSKLIVDNIMAREIATGASALMNYGMRITGGMSNFFAFLVSMYSIKYFSDIKKNNSNVPKKKFLGITSSLFLFLSLFTFVIFVFSQEIVQLMFQKSTLTLSEFAEVVKIQKLYSFQLIFGVLGTLSMRMLITYEEYKFLLKLSIFSFIMNIVFNIYFSKFYGIAGISLSSSVSYGLVFLIQAAKILSLRTKEV
jgi:putative peptidoglycan lipid II flippase